MTLETFAKQFYIQNGDNIYCKQPDAIGWTKNGRIGSHWQIGEDMYVLVEKDGDDPYKYYNPEPQGSQLSGKSWHDSSKCGGNNGCGGCSC